MWEQHTGTVYDDDTEDHIEINSSWAPTAVDLS